MHTFQITKLMFFIDNVKNMAVIFSKRVKNLNQIWLYTESIYTFRKGIIFNSHFPNF